MRAILLALLLAGCASKPPIERVVIQRVEIPVSTPCPKTLAPPPVYTDTKEALAKAGGAEYRYQLLAGNWFIRDARLNLLEGVIAECRRPSPPSQ